MIDIHSHVLPFVDDGSENTETSLAMLKDLSEQGVTDLICTPHYRNAFKASYGDVKEIFDSFDKTRKENGINVNLYLGREFYITKDFKKVLAEWDKDMTLNRSEYLLTEFDMTVKAEVPEIVYELTVMGYKPVVAHIERYGYCSLEDAFEVKEMGGLIQINADSVAGKSKKAFYGYVKKLFKNGLVDFVSSDIHSGRADVMAAAEKFVSKKFGEDVAKEVFYENAKKIIEG